MEGKVCLITGATAGIGFVTARELARRGASVTIVGRNVERCRVACEAITREAKYHVEYIVADLSAQSDVRRCAHEFLARQRKLDVLINNVGAMFALRNESVDGIEMTFAVNHLAPFLLTNLLLDALKRAAPARIVNVASEAHEDIDRFDFNDPQAKRGYPTSEISSLFFSLLRPMSHPAIFQYARTKLANILFTRELAERLAGSGVTANALHPGIVASEFGSRNGIYGWFTRRFLALTGMSVEEGAKTSIYLATAPELENVSGEYFVKCRPARCSDAARDDVAAKRLWILSEELTRDREHATIFPPNCR